MIFFVSFPLITLLTLADAAQNCYYCPEPRLKGEPVDCRNADAGFHGHAITCAEIDGYSGDLCLKRIGKREDFCEYSAENRA